MNSIQDIISWGHYKYIGSDPMFQGHTALGQLEQGSFWVQVDHFKHPWSHCWHETPIEDWEKIDE